MTQKSSQLFLIFQFKRHYWEGYHFRYLMFIIAILQWVTARTRSEKWMEWVEGYKILMRYPVRWSSANLRQFSERSICRVWSIYQILGSNFWCLSEVSLFWITLTFFRYSKKLIEKPKIIEGDDRESRSSSERKGNERGVVPVSPAWTRSPILLWLFLFLEPVRRLVIIPTAT